MKAKLSNYININRIEFIVTWQCGGRCRHCQVGGDINKKGAQRHVLAEPAVNAVRQIAGMCGVTSVLTFGGEPLYYPEVVASIHGAAAECGIRTRQIITNGYFTNDEARSREVAQMLADAGVNNLLLSVDAFHQEHIPIGPVRRFAQALAEVKLPRAYLYPAWLVSEAHDNPYNAKTRELLTEFSEGPLPIMRCDHHVTPAGLAAAELREYFTQDEPEATETEPGSALDPSAPCGELLNVTNISIVPNGDMMVCKFVIGNIYEEEAADIIARYDPHKYEKCVKCEW
jgi:sulfatase maturation enzyme AslB (radical SAM superfamily)